MQTCTAVTKGNKSHTGLLLLKIKSVSEGQEMLRVQ